jgi:hypothetical protein
MTDQSTDRPNWNCYDSLPHNHWRKCARRFLEPCQSDLWSNKSAAQSARRFLRNRGFTRETLKRAGIGLNIKDRYGDRSYWGLPIGAPVGPHGRIWLPRGLVFPWFDDEGLSRLYIRRLRNDVDPESDDPKENTAGHRTPNCIAPLYGAQWVDSDLPVVLVEREFDALAIQEEAGDLCSPAATGHPGGARRKEWWRLLSNVPAVLVAFDSSEAGEEAKAAWMDALPNAHQWETYTSGSDDRMTPGRRLREWVQDGLESISPKP